MSARCCPWPGRGEETLGHNIAACYFNVEVTNRKLWKTRELVAKSYGCLFQGWRIIMIIIIMIMTWAERGNGWAQHGFHCLHHMPRLCYGYFMINPMVYWYHTHSCHDLNSHNFKLRVSNPLLYNSHNLYNVCIIWYRCCPWPGRDEERLAGVEKLTEFASFVNFVDVINRTGVCEKTLLRRRGHVGR